jgi:CheY-like chemotaxis protein
MSEQAKTVIVVEDNKLQLEAISKTLTRYGFNALSGDTIARSLELLREHKDDASVIILDMDLSKFPDFREQNAIEGGTITGVRLTQRVLRQSRARRPEIIILSTYTESAYYKEAIKAGASDYLSRGEEPDKQSFVASVQALALKHSFQPSPPNDAEIALLADGHANSFELMSHFCQHKLSRELDLCLAHASHVLLLRHTGGGDSFAVYSEAPGLPSAEEFDYPALHRKIFGQVSRHAAYTVGDDDAPPGRAGALKGCTFVQLVQVSQVELALGVLSPFPVRDDVDAYSFRVPALADALIDHAAPVLDSFVEKLIFRWREKQSVKLERVRALAGFGDAVLRRLNALLRRSRPAAPEQAAAAHERLQQLTAEFNDYGRTLSTLLDAAEAAPPDGEMPRLSEIVQEIKSDYDRLGYFAEVSFAVEADCVAPARRYYLSLALRELVKWAVGRRAEVPPGERQQLRLRCAARGNWLEIYFGERSARLSEDLRAELLSEPLSPLHLARMIVEVACHGSLVDVTDESPEAAGHLFKIRLLGG